MERTLVHNFLKKWMIFFHLSSSWFCDLYITKNCVFCWYTTAEKQKLNFFNHWTMEKVIQRCNYYLILIPLPPYAKCQMRFWKAIMFCPLHSMTVFWVIAKVFQFYRSHISTMYSGTFWFFLAVFSGQKRSFGAHIADT